MPIKEIVIFEGLKTLNNDDFYATPHWNLNVHEYLYLYSCLVQKKYIYAVQRQHPLLEKRAFIVYKKNLDQKKLYIKRRTCIQDGEDGTDPLILIFTLTGRFLNPQGS